MRTLNHGGVELKGRTWTAEQRLAIVLEGLKGAKPVAEICWEHRLAQTQYYQWRDRFLEGGTRKGRKPKAMSHHRWR